MSIKSAIAALKEVLGEQVSTSKPDLDFHGQSETHFAPAPPDAVFYPEATEDVSKALAICQQHQCPVIAWGCGTSLEGHTAAIAGGVTIDLSKMNRILAVNQDDMDVRVQPGITREALNAELRATGLFFPVDPGANASIGGMAATRASGTTAVRYGTMSDNVLALEVVLADGRIIETGTRARKSSAGYDLTKLFVGSEGTLGIITEISLRLFGQPEAITAAISAFPDMNLAVDAVINTIQAGIPIARVEFVDASTARAFNQYSGASMPELPHLMLEFHGSQSAVSEHVARVGEIIAEFCGSGFQYAEKTEDRTALWKMRHDAYYAILSLKSGATALVTDICVPISKLAQAVRETADDIALSNLPGPILGHVGDGNFHAILLIDPNDAQEKQTALDLSNRMAMRAIALGGTVTGEHGIGIGKKTVMAAEHGEAWQIMTDIKKALDPSGIMNPGKLVNGN